jgi:hypothetical protein
VPHEGVSPLTATVQSAVRVVADTWREDETIRELVAAAQETLSRNPKARARDLRLEVRTEGRRTRYSQRSARAVLSFRLEELV